MTRVHYFSAQIRLRRYNILRIMRIGRFASATAIRVSNSYYIQYIDFRYPQEWHGLSFVYDWYLFNLAIATIHLICNIRFSSVKCLRAS